MSRVQTRRRSQGMGPAGKKDLEQTLRRQMARAAGTEAFQHRDPLYHVTESFQQTFDAMGRRHAARLVEDEPVKREAWFRQDSPDTQEAQKTDDAPDPASARSFYERGDGQDQDMIQRFSETAFQRGTMSAAVLRGTGKVMLFSCLKKAVGQSQPVREQQRKLFENASQARNVPGHVPDRFVFNRGFTDSAVGLVVDTLRDARRTVEDMQGLVQGNLNRTESGKYGADTLHSMYPFLDDSREREMLEGYYAQLNGPEALGTDERALIQGAVGRTRALIGKKAQMRVEFINKLRFISDRAAEALAEFEEPGFAAGLNVALLSAFGVAALTATAGDGESGGEDGTAVEPPNSGKGTDDGAADQGADRTGGAADPAPGGTGPDARTPAPE